MPHGQDTIRTTDGFQCSQAISPSAYLDSGLYSSVRDSQQSNSDYGFYVRVMIPLGGSQDRINCKELYDFEMKYRQQMKMIEGLRNEIFD